MTATFRDLWLRRQRAARRNRFAIAHARCIAHNYPDHIAWVKIDTEGLLCQQQTDAAKDPLILLNAKRKRLRALEF
jgi:hypothetical protein